MVVERGTIHWTDLGEPSGSRPANRRPVLVVQADDYNASRLATVLVAVLRSNTKLAAAPGNVFLPASATGLPRDSVANVTTLVALNKGVLTGKAGESPTVLMREVDSGLRRVLGL